MPPTWRRKETLKRTLRFGSGTAVYLRIPSCLCLLSLKAALYRRIMSSATGSDLLLFLSYRGYAKVRPDTYGVPGQLRADL